jgi:GT2 family glycosyltransferase
VNESSQDLHWKTSSTPAASITATVSVVIATYGREQVLVETIQAVLPQVGAGELIVIDQTPRHEEATEAALSEWDRSGAIRWIRIERPSITGAMNRGLRVARFPVVLFLDDDVIPVPDLLAKHAAAYERDERTWAVVGQVLQPGEEPGSRGSWSPQSGFRGDIEFPFWSTEPATVSNVIACNLSVRRVRAIEIGGFDENFTGVAYRFETEFARRVVDRGGVVRFEPAASIRHLRATRGGTRAQGSHLTSASPRYGVGDYYFAMRCGKDRSALAYILRRPFREVCTRFHLRHPWYIPVKFVGEIRALLAARSLKKAGPQLMNSTASTVESKEFTGSHS